ncbi:HotDog domain-containing protein [Cladochytrium replicatum]|nr:HotDog domain-containing protein [Cladochytrium replicatum]
MDRIKQIQTHLAKSKDDLKKEAKEETMKRVWAMLDYNEEGSRDYNNFLLDACKIVDASVTEGRAVFEFTVTKDYANGYGTLHGGVTASLVDLISTGAIIALTNKHYGVSLEMAITYISAAQIGDTIRVESVCQKAGRSLAFTNTLIYVGDRLVAKGNHTKFNVGLQ